MIRLAFFDLGETLIHDNQPFPHAVDALRAIRQFVCENGAPLTLGLISDFLPPDPPGKEDQIAAREGEYAAILAGAGLSEFFEPFSARVTLSTRAGVLKPDKRIFLLAAERSGTGAGLSECLFVTEDSGHLEKCKGFNMHPVRFGSGTGITPAFSDWSDAPMVINNLVNPTAAQNRAHAIAATLAARFDMIGFSPSTPVAGHVLEGRARRLTVLEDPKLGDLSGICVELPSAVTVTVGADGNVANVVATPPASDEVADAVNFVASLQKSGKVATAGCPAAGATHVVEQDAEGRRRLVRRGYDLR
jgi:FMN phosphatase YigB (HAD superfamily)